MLINSIGNVTQSTPSVKTSSELCQYQFNGTDEYLDFGDILDGVISGSAPEFTIQMWIKRGTLAETQILIGKFDFGGLLGFKLAFVSDNTLQWIQSSTGSDTQGTNSDDTYTDNTNWIHIAFTLDYTQASYTLAPKLYMNGVEIDQTPTTSTKNIIYNTSAPLVIGTQDTPSPQQFFDGQFRQASIQSRVLTPAEILADYNLGNPKAPTDDVEFYVNSKTDTFSTNWTVKDLSPNGNDGISINMIEGDRTCSIVALNQNMISLFTNGVVYSEEVGYDKRSTASEYNFNYTGTQLWLRANVTNSSNLVILIDGSLHLSLTMVNGVLYQLTLPSGSKYVQLIEPQRTTTALLGVSLEDILPEVATFSKANPTSEVDRFVFLGDSITQGSAGTNPVLNGYAALFKYTDSEPVTILGFAGATLKDVVDLTGSSLTTTISWIADSFENTTGRKVLTIMLGTNDWADGFSTASINTRYETLVDAINVADSDVEVFCISPTYRDGEDVDMTTIRANVLTMCTARAWCTGIDGTSIIGAPDLADTVHPTDAGHVKIHDAIDSIIL